MNTLRLIQMLITPLALVDTVFGYFYLVMIGIILNAKTSPEMFIPLLSIAILLQLRRNIQEQIRVKVWAQEVIEHCDKKLLKTRGD